MNSDEKKPATKKKVATKRKPRAKKDPEIISYGIKMVIPTVAFGNIQPEIIVKANSIDEAHDFIVPHMNKMWKEYYLVDGRRPDSTPPIPGAGGTGDVPVTPLPVSTGTPPPVDIIADTTPEVTNPTGDTPPSSPALEVTSPPTSSVAMVKAIQAIKSCMSMDALKLIITQVLISVKLTDEDKAIINPLIAEKELELNENK